MAPNSSQRSPQPMQWLTVLLLLATAAIIVWGLGNAWLYTVSHAGVPPCPNPPSRNGSPPQLAVVGICLVAFAAGHFSARFQKFDVDRLMRDGERTPIAGWDHRGSGAL